MKRNHPPKDEPLLAETFAGNFNALTDFLKRNNRFPGKENQKLYTWMVCLIKAYREKRLDEEYAARLDAIGFIWSKRELDWVIKAARIKEMLMEHKAVGLNNNKLLAYWLESNLERFLKDLLPAEKNMLIREINGLLKEVKRAIVWQPVVRLSAREMKWMEKFDELVQYRKINPKSWPRVATMNRTEKKLGIWCQGLRYRWRKNVLEEKWITRLEEIGFNFEGRLDNWKDKCKELKSFLENNREIPDTKSELYTWARFQFIQYNTLPQEKQRMLQSINFLQYYQQKEQDNKYAELEEFVIEYKALPTKATNGKLFNWLSAQKIKYNKGALTDREVSLLVKLGVAFSSTGKREKAWELRYKALIEFRERCSGRWPNLLGDNKEKQLAIWCQTQRGEYAKIAQGLEGLSRDKIEKLNQIGFHWCLEELLNKKWDDNFRRLERCIANSGKNHIPVKIDGKYNKLYTWLKNQRKAIRKGNLSSDKIERLKALGVVVGGGESRRKTIDLVNPNRHAEMAVEN